MPGLINTSILQSDAGAIVNSNNYAEDIMQTCPVYGYSDLAGIVTLAYTGFQVRLSGAYYTVAGSTIALNAGALAVPTTHYVYVQLTLGVATVVVSTSDPDTVLTSGYAYMQIARFKSVAGTITYQYVIDTCAEAYRLGHNVGDYSRYTRPIWLTGMVMSTAAGGTISTTLGTARRILAQIAVAAINAGTIILGDEATTAAGLNNIATYSDGSAITAGKYHKVLIGIIASPTATYKLIIMPQGKPAVEYATKAAANADAEFMAATAFTSGYKPIVIPIAYYTMLKGDYTDFTLVDIRENGILTGGGGGGAGVVDHGALAGLADDDHGQYALLAGRAGGQAVYGGTAANDPLTLVSTFNADKGEVYVGGDGLANTQRTDEVGFNWMVGTARAWDDIVIPLENIATGSNAPTTITLVGNIQALAFRGTSNINEIFGGVEMLHGYDEGTDISFHAHWMPTNNVVANVKWQLEYTWANIGAVFPATTTTSVTTATAGANLTHQISAMLLAGAGKKIGSVLKFRFFRDPTDAADTYTNNATVSSIGVHYQLNSHGSRSITAK